MHARHVEEDKARRGRKLTLTEAGRGDEQLRSQLQQMLLTYAIAVLTVSSLVGFCIIFTSSRSLRVASLCLLTIGAIVAVFLGLMVDVFECVKQPWFEH